MIVRHDGVVRSQVVLVAIGFNLAEKLPAGPIDVDFTLQENVWNGRRPFSSTSVIFGRTSRLTS